MEREDNTTVLTPSDLDEAYLGRDLRERTPESVLKVHVSSLERGSLTVYLEAGEAFEVTEDGPNSVTAEVLVDAE